MDEQKNKIIEKEKITEDEIASILSKMPGEKVCDFLVAIYGLIHDDYDIMPESALEFFSLDEKASDEVKTKSQKALAKRRGAVLE